MILRKHLYKSVSLVKTVVNHLLFTLGKIYFSDNEKIVNFPKLYPRAEIVKGKHVLKLDEENKIICNACELCALNCPSQCISVTGEDGKLERFELKILKCTFCGFCVDVCPINALGFSNETLMSGFAEQNWNFDKNELAFRSSSN